MITKINTIKFVRAVKVKKTKNNPEGLGPKRPVDTINNKNQLWEDGLYIEKNNGIAGEGDNGIFGIILDSDLKQVTEIWDANDRHPSLIIQTQIGK